MSETPLSAVVEALRRHPRLGPQVVHATRLPGQPASWAAPDPPLPASLGAALAARGVERLWSHQAEGLAAARAGEDVLVTTPTASGKSLVFQLPVLEEAARGGPGRALFLYPLKALGQDQRAKLEELAAGAGIACSCAIYDGDTSPSRRARLRREPPRVLISNPDMLHLGILPSWPSWQPFLAELSWIVLDELHTYRGIFGSHFHHVLQRLLRLARLHGSEPRIIASSATAANADEFARALTGRRFHRIAESGAPRDGRWMLLLQPSASPYTATLQLLVELLRQGLKTIVFTKARRITELLYRWLRAQEPELARRVASYRAGFLPEERRSIEARLFDGSLQGVISTSALEMGIDVGGLDACILVGWPGSVMATWQRSGRAGRNGRESLTALVALPDALDQWLVRHPEELLARPCEPLVVDPANPPVARQHLPCAAAEEPLDRDVDSGYLDAHSDTVGELVGGHELRASADGRLLYARGRRPHRGVGLRGGGETFAIATLGDGRTIGTVDGVRAMHECHPGAVYLHGGRQYLVRQLDLGAARVRVEPVELDWYTSALAEKQTRILEVVDERHELARGAGGVTLSAWLGRLQVTERVTGYERKRVFSQEALSQHDLDLPPVSFETVGLWWAATPAVVEALRAEGRHVLGSLHAAEHTSIALLPLLALCDRNDIGGISLPMHPQIGCGAVFVYDGHAGGIGIARRGFDALPELLGRVGELLAGCPCDDGCPSCVQSPKCGNGNRPLDKAGARELVALLLGARALPASGPWELRLDDWEEPAARGRPSAQLALPPFAAAGEPAFQWPEAPAPAAGALAVTAAEPPHPVSRRHEGTRPGTRRGARPPIELGARPAEPASREPRAPEPTPPEPWLARTLRALRLAPRRWSFPAPLWPWRRRPAQPGTVLFDLETLRSAADVGGWHNTHRMGLAMAVVCHLEQQRFEVFREGQAEALGSALRAARLVVGFNLRRFDYRVLAGYTGADYNRLVPTLDLLEEIHRALGFRLRLDHLARETLGSGKSADGLVCLQWVREGRLDLVEEYCRRDVEVLRDLYLFGRREGYVMYRDRAERRLRLPVRW